MATNFDTSSRDIVGNRPESQSSNSGRPSQSNVPPHPRSDMTAPITDGSFGANNRAIQPIPQSPPFPPQVAQPQPFRPVVPTPRIGPKG
jgi:hypothetical protein